MHIYTDSRSLCERLVNINRTNEKRPLIDLLISKQSYERRDLDEVYWISTAQNPEDGFTKDLDTSALDFLISNNKVNFTQNVRVERPMDMEGRGIVNQSNDFS